LYISFFSSYLAFENELQTGYVTEKLFETLRLPLVPIYWGSPITPNITKTPSFIKATDFRSPKELAEYLLYLDKNPAEYEKYRSWRHDPQPFTDDYLDALKHRMISPIEINIHRRMKRHTDDVDSKRMASCCRLCNPSFLKSAAEMRKHLPNGIVPAPLSQPTIKHQYFQRIE
jgi:hypothetical protein